jgi:hypothetical protein
MKLRAPLLAAALLALAASGAAAEDEAPGARPRIYRWVDDNGIAHYTTDPERIPAALRSRIAEPAPLVRKELEARAPQTTRESWAATDRPPSVAPAAPEGDAESLGPVGDFSDEENPQARARREQLDARISELEAAIARDEEALKARISDPSSGGPLVAGDDPEFRTIASRLPEQLAELRQLREERASLEAGS